MSGTTPVNLAACVSWQKLLRYAGVETAGSLPANVRCPLCRQVSLTIYQDTTCGGQWHVCSRCRFRGDNLEMAAATFSLKLPEVVPVLADAGVMPARIQPESIQESLSAYTLKQHQARSIWESAENLLDGCPHIAQAVGSATADPSTWSHRGGRLIRRVAREVAETICGPHRPVWRPYKPHRDWREAAIIPFEDLPGRISAFAIGIDVPPGLLTWTYQPVHQSGCPEGLTPMECVTSTAGCIFVLVDAVHAVHAHVRNLDDKNALASIVGIWPEAPAPMFLKSTGRPIVVCGPATHDLFRVASQLDARVYAVQDNRLFTYRHLTFAAMAAEARLRSRPWREALKKRLKDLPEVAAEEFMRGLNIDCRDARLVAPRSLQTKELKIAVVDGYRVLEDDDGWRLAASNEILSDVSLRIDTALAQPGTGKLWYQGTVRYRRSAIPFTVPREKLESNPFRFAQQTVVEAGLGVPQIKNRWRSRFLELAMSFHPPQPAVAREAGWDGNKNEFVLPRYKISAAGVVSPHHMPELSSLPAADKFPMPVVMTREELAEMRNWSDGVWRVFLTIAYNLLAPVYGYDHTGLIFTEAFGEAEGLAQTLGCPAAEPPRGEQRAGDLENVGGWPVVIKGPIRVFTAWSRWLKEPHNFLVGVDSLEARILAANGNWFLLTDTAAHEDGADRLLADFLSFAVTNQLRGLWGAGPMARLRKIFENYFEARGAHIPAIDRVSRLMEADQTADLFGHVAACLTTRGYIKAPNNRAGIRLDVMQINKALADRAMPTFEIEKVAAKMHNLISERNSQVWLVPNAWWEKQMEAWKSGKRATLRLAN